MQYIKQQNYSLHHTCHDWLYQDNVLISRQHDLHTFSFCRHNEMMPLASNQQGVSINKWWLPENNSKMKVNKICVNKNILIKNVIIVKCK